MTYMVLLVDSSPVNEIVIRHIYRVQPNPNIKLYVTTCVIGKDEVKSNYIYASELQYLLAYG